MILLKDVPYLKTQRPECSDFRELSCDARVELVVEDAVKDLTDTCGQLKLLKVRGNFCIKENIAE